MDVEKKIEMAIEKFNKYRYPEAFARLEEVSSKTIRVSFEGIFKETCGFYDYFEDLLVFLDELGIDAWIEEIQETEEGADVIFSLEIAGGGI